MSLLSERGRPGLTDLPGEANKTCKTKIKEKKKIGQQKNLTSVLSHQRTELLH